MLQSWNEDSKHLLWIYPIRGFTQIPQLSQQHLLGVLSPGESLSDLQS